MKPFIDASSPECISKHNLSYKSSSASTLIFRLMNMHMKWHHVLMQIWIICPIHFVLEKICTQTLLLPKGLKEGLKV
jgi:hypothetical protein